MGSLGSSRKYNLTFPIQEKKEKESTKFSLESPNVAGSSRRIPISLWQLGIVPAALILRDAWDTGTSNPTNQLPTLLLLPRDFPSPSRKRIPIFWNYLVENKGSAEDSCTSGTAGVLGNELC